MRKETLNHISPKPYAAPEIKVVEIGLDGAILYISGGRLYDDESGTEDDDVTTATFIWN